MKKAKRLIPRARRDKKVARRTKRLIRRMRENLRKSFGSSSVALNGVDRPDITGAYGANPSYSEKPIQIPDGSSLTELCMTR